MLLVIVLCCPLLVAGLTFDDAAGTVRLTISQGELLGRRIDSYENRTGYGFLGVPFAAPPVGPLRFAKPVPAPGWEGVRNVTVKGVACATIPEMTYKRPEGGPMGEDCLHSYIYASRTCLEKGGCPIMWVLHGGKYKIESPINFDDNVIVHNFASDGQDVVVIVPAYRLENFGFLNIAPGMNTSATPNAAVWDLLLALQWTHREAANFGGDANRITIHGHSAGAQFQDVMSTSSHFDGLYHGMSIMSGADSFIEADTKSGSLASWITATLLGCASESTNRMDIAAVEAVIECMRGKTWEEIAEANRQQNNYAEEYHGPHADGPGGILPFSPAVLGRIHRPKMPIMIGTAAAEFQDTRYLLNADGTADATKVGELCEAFAYGIGYANPDVMTKRCLDYYTHGNNSIGFNQDTQFFAPTFHTAREMAKAGSKVYVYSFTYKGVGAGFRAYMKLHEDDHPSHSEDYVYILGLHRGNFTLRDYEIEKIYSGMILNFVKTGYPHPGEGQPEWKPFTDKERNYYEIDFDDHLRMPGTKVGYEAGAVKLWVDDAEKYGGPVTQPDQFPPHIDRFYQMDVVSVFEAHHGVNATSLKSFASQEASYYDWTNFTRNLRYKQLQGANVRSIVIDTSELAEASYPANLFMVDLLIIFVSAVLIFLLFRCWMGFVKREKGRKDYEKL